MKTENLVKVNIIMALIAIFLMTITIAMTHAATNVDEFVKPYPFASDPVIPYYDGYYFDCGYFEYNAPDGHLSGKVVTEYQEAVQCLSKVYQKVPPEKLNKEEYKDSTHVNVKYTWSSGEPGSGESIFVSLTYYATNMPPWG